MQRILDRVARPAGRPGAPSRTCCMMAACRRAGQYAGSPAVLASRVRSMSFHPASTAQFWRPASSALQTWYCPSPIAFSPF